MSGIGSFKGTGSPALPSATSGGLGAFSPPAGGTQSPGLPTLNPNTGTTSFQRMHANRGNVQGPLASNLPSPNPTAFSAAINSSSPYRESEVPYYIGRLAKQKHLGNMIPGADNEGDTFNEDARMLRGRLELASTTLDDGRIAIPADVFGRITEQGNGIKDAYLRKYFRDKKVEISPMMASLSPNFVGDSESDIFNKGEIKPWYKKERTQAPSWENGYASGGLVSLGSAYRNGGAVEPQAAPHSPAMPPQASPPDASPESEKLYMGAMMALDPSYPMSDEDRSMIIETFIDEFGEEELNELEAEVAARSSDGRSDSIPATLGGKPAALSEGEYVLPADAVSGLGQGSTEAGARRLDDLVRQTRSASAQNVGRPIGPSPLKGVA